MDKNGTVRFLELRGKVPAPWWSTETEGKRSSFTLPTLPLLQVNTEQHQEGFLQPTISPVAEREKEVDIQLPQVSVFPTSILPHMECQGN